VGHCWPFCPCNREKRQVLSVALKGERRRRGRGRFSTPVPTEGRRRPTLLANNVAHCFAGGGEKRVFLSDHKDLKAHVNPLAIAFVIRGKKGKKPDDHIMPGRR